MRLRAFSGETGCYLRRLYKVFQCVRSSISSKISSTNLRSEKNRGWQGLSVFTSTFLSFVVRFERSATLSAERAAASRYLTR